MNTAASLKELCVVRDSVFQHRTHDEALDLTHLIEDDIDAGQFFRENYITDGMRQLLREAFRRFQGNSPTGVIKLTQAMGGGKTHNMIALGLLAKHPELRKTVMGDLYEGAELGEVRVVGFTGRESDYPYGIWGAIAEQLEKKEQLSAYYAPLSAPGQTAWINLLQGKPLLILLDELPPYFENAKSKAIGNSDLSVVTTTALANLLVAVNRTELSNVCVVVADLKATYEGGTHRINQALQNLENEVGRGALNLEPVGLNTDEVYHILRTRLFSNLPAKETVAEVADAYGAALKEARQMDLTNQSPELIARQVRESYPFHPAIKDLYARFRENPGFQQTRGLIRLMRVVVSRLFAEGGRANQIQLIHAHDLDLNDRETVAQVATINPSLENAISHDISAAGQAVSEQVDATQGGSDARDVSTLLLMSSLANVPNALIGLTLAEIISDLAIPGRDLTRLKEAISLLTTKAWYVHANREGRLFFKNTQNLVAKLNSTASALQRPDSIKELRTVLGRIFTPTKKDCYQQVEVLPALDQVQITPDKVTLILFEPHPLGMHPDLHAFYDNQAYKNRVLFLTGQRDTLESLLEVAKEHRAITEILAEMNQEKVPDNDPQRLGAQELTDKIRLRLLSAARETFNTLIYPHSGQLLQGDFYMNFNDNDYHGEHQIRETLKAKQKFTEDVAGETFAKKCEARLFTQKNMLWSEVTKRAATTTSWQWHHVDALDHLKDKMVSQGQWREQSSYVEKGPFAPPSTDVQWQELNRNDDTGEVTLRLHPVHGDTIHYEIGGPATPASLKVEDPRQFKTSEMVVSFLCIDSTSKHDKGEPRAYRNRLTIQSRTFQAGMEKMVEIKVAPDAAIRYSTDGSDPRIAGATYNEPFPVSPGTSLVLATAEKGGIGADQHRLDIDWSSKAEFKLDPTRPVTWKRTHKCNTTKDSYEFLNRLKKWQGKVPGPSIAVLGATWVELNFDANMPVTAEQLESALEYLRALVVDGEITIEAYSVVFPAGENLLNWVGDEKLEIQSEEVEQ